MKRISINQMNITQGGGRCDAAAGVITGVGLAAFSIPTPLNIAFGIVVTGVGLLSYASCP